MVDNELITKVRVRNVKSILSNVFTSSGGTITNGNGTTANGTAVDWGGALGGNVVITGSDYSITQTLFETGTATKDFIFRSYNDGGNDYKMTLGAYNFQVRDNGNAHNFIDILSGNIQINSLFDFTLASATSPASMALTSSGLLLNLSSDAIGDVYHRNASGYLTRRGTVSAASTSSLTINSDTTYQYSLTSLAAALSIEAPTGTPFNGQDLLIRILDNGTARALTWNAIFRVIGVTLPTTTVISKTMYIACIYNSTDTKWDVIGVREQA